MINNKRARAWRKLPAFAAISLVTACAPANNQDISKNCASDFEKITLSGGTFLMGSGDGYPEEAPSREASVAAFAIDSHEVTNARFAEFVAATGYITEAEKKPDPDLHPDIPTQSLVPGSAVFRPPEETGQWWHFVEGASWLTPKGPDSNITNRTHHPVVHVSYNDAAAFAHWAGGDLPSEAEWEYAARGGLSGENYEWGGEAVEDGLAKANTWQGIFPIQNTAADGFEEAAPVGCFRANGFGLRDMTGNVWEWTKSTYGSGNDTGNNKTGTIKGGSFLCSANFCSRYRPAARQAHERGFSTSHIGFRVVYRIEVVRN